VSEERKIAVQSGYGIVIAILAGWVGALPLVLGITCAAVILLAVETKR
jgi:hypothetical protein